MDIPYTVQARPDTGLFNAKVGIWLFLASEVMLFGALFSSYILLRVGSNVWPHGLLNVPIGMFNTIVLITSSITMVMAWANAKMNHFGKSRLFLGITVLCGLIFLCVKSKEYYDKFVHYEVRLTDGTVMEGHIEERSADFKLNRFKPEAGELVFLPASTYKGQPGDTLTEMKGHFLSEKSEHKVEAEHHAPVELQASQIAWMSNYTPKHSTFFAIYFTLTGLHALHVIGGMCVLGFFWGPGAKLWKTDPERYTNRLEVGGLFWHFVDLVWIFLFPVLYLL